MRILAIIGALAVAAVIAGVVYFFAGFYNVSGIEQDSGVIAAALVQIRQASILRHATATPPLSLQDPALIREGARAFAERGCVRCHGGPGVKWAKFSEGLNPGPPDLKEIVNDIKPRALFWIVKNGIKMTGMPSFGAIGTPDHEIWAIAAFLKKLPTVSDQDFKAWSAPEPGKKAKD